LLNDSFPKEIARGLPRPALSGGNTLADATLLDYGGLNDNADLLLLVTPNGGKTG
jgi:hypothetical protein